MLDALLWWHSNMAMNYMLLMQVIVVVAYAEVHTHSLTYLLTHSLTYSLTYIGDGSAFPLSEDHKPQQSREFTRIANAGGFVTGAGRINGNLNLSRALGTYRYESSHSLTHSLTYSILGDLKYKQTRNIPKEDQIITAEPDITVTTLLPDDRFFVLACDGTIPNSLTHLLTHSLTHLLRGLGLFNL